MWIVRLALRRPYTVAVMALLILRRVAVGIGEGVGEGGRVQPVE